MTEQEPIPEELRVWLQDCHVRVQRLLDQANPVPPQAKFDELVKLAQQFLSLSRSLLSLSQTTMKAARSMQSSQPPDQERPV